jgi:hypothetical protein
LRFGFGKLASRLKNYRVRHEQARASKAAASCRTPKRVETLVSRLNFMRINSVVWSESSTVAETLAERLEAELHLLPCPRRSALQRPAAYRKLSRVTSAILFRIKPNVVLVQNPPIHAVACVADYARRQGANFIIDAHSFAFLGQGWMQDVYRRRFARFGASALVTLIHNEGLIPYAEALGLRYLVLEMAVPERPTQELAQIRHPAVVAVCGNGQDEPIEELLDASRRMLDVRFHITGPSSGRVVPAANVEATGFLESRDYWRLLNAADAVVVLTTREATILSGAYEGLAAGKPLVLSRTEALKKAFPKAAVLVENQAEAIASGIRQALAESGELAKQGVLLREEKAQTWEAQFRALRQIIDRGRTH